VARFLPYGSLMIRPAAVLIAESEPDLAEVLGCILRDAKYRTTLALDAVEAVSGVAHDVPDVLVLDLHLAKLAGLLILEVLRAITRGVPVVLLAPPAWSLPPAAAERFNVVAVLGKPFRIPDLLAAIARALGHERKELTICD
jgi:CheY-like chemotaxis protein